MNIPFPTCIRDVQRLACQVATLSHFISRSFEKYHLFFSTLRKSKDFEWTPSCKEALRDLKKYLTSPLLLSKPKDGEQIFIYLVVSETTICIVLIREEDNKKLLVYYVSKSLLDAEKCYTQLEKKLHSHLYSSLQPASYDHTSSAIISSYSLFTL